MAARITSNPQQHLKLGRRHLIAIKAALILFLVVQPGYAGTPSGKGGSGGGGGCSSGGSGPPPPPPSNRVAQELYNDYSTASGADHLLAPEALFESIDGEAYVAQIVNGTGQGSVRLPGYSYFQGLVQADNHVTVAGQVRIIGGVLGASGIDKDDAAAGVTTADVDGTLNLYRGAMVTSNAQAFVGADDVLQGGPSGIKTRIKSWREIPAP